jgi:uncharacterized membrane protein YkoI
MKRIFSILAGFSLATCLLAAQARAIDLENEEEAKEHENARQYLAKAKITLADAITRALKKYPNGAAVEAGFDVLESKTGKEFDFIVEIADGGHHHEVEIDAITGKLDSDEEEPIAESLKEDNENTAAKSKITLVKAIAAALEAVPGAKAFEIEADLDEDKLSYEVGLLLGKDIYHVQVDGSTGKVLGKEKVDK